MKSFFRDNSLTVALVALFLFSALGMIWSGHSAYNEELQHHGCAAISAEAALMIPGAIAACGRYAELTMRVVIIAGEEDRLLDIDRQSSRLHLELPAINESASVA